MSELTFARQFLSALDSRPIKLSSDHVVDPKTYSQAGVPILPRYPSSPQKRKRGAPGTTSSPTSEPSISVTLSPLKKTTGVEPLTSSLSPKTSIFDLKTAYAAYASLNVVKIKILYNKKPCADTKMLSELSDPLPDKLDLSVMLLPGATSAPPSAAPSPGISEPPNPMATQALAGKQGEVADLPMPDAAPTAQGSSGLEELKTDAFWSDLDGFLKQRLRDEHVASKVCEIFKAAWEKGNRS